MPTELIILVALLWGLVLYLVLKDNSARLRRAIGDTTRQYDASAELVPYHADHSQDVIRIPTERPQFTAWREAPATNHEPTLEGHVAVPGLQSLMVAVAVGVLVVAVGVALGWGATWRLALVSFALALLVALLHRISFFSKLLVITETITRTDLDGNGVIGKPAVSYMLTNPYQARQAIAETNRADERQRQLDGLLAFVDRCATTGTAESAHGIEGGGHRAEYCAMRDTLLALGLAEWKNPRRPRTGWTLTTTPDHAKAVLERHVLTL